MSTDQDKVAKGILGTRQSGTAFETYLKTDERVLARIMDGIYRQPSSALRELISNAYDADATEVVILTDYPRFETISVRDNGLGFTADSMAHMITSIGGSGKRRKLGARLNQTSTKDSSKSPGGRKLIGKLGVGLFSVAQLTRHFLIITKVKGENYRTVADITLVDDFEEDRKAEEIKPDKPDIAKAHAKIFQEPATDIDSQGTEVILLNVLPRTRTELSGWLRWQRIDTEKEEGGKAETIPPKFHIGKYNPNDTDPSIQLDANLPWEKEQSPTEKFQAFVAAVRQQALRYSDVVDLDVVCDNYLQSLWTLSLTTPIDYIDTHPFDLTGSDDISFYSLENKVRGQANELKINTGDTPRKIFALTNPDLEKGDSFRVEIDGVELKRPITYRDRIKSPSGPTRPMLFLGRMREEFHGQPRELSGGTLDFEAYLFWTHKIIPKQHQGVMVRINNAAATYFDRTFMGYQVSEQNRLRQIVAEIYVKQGLDDALNLDRESFNTSHAHYQVIMKWLHSAIRQLTNKNKAVGKVVREEKRTLALQAAKDDFASMVESMLAERQIEDLPEIRLVSRSEAYKIDELRNDGFGVFLKEDIIPEQQVTRMGVGIRADRERLERRAIAIAQILECHGLFESLSFEEQTRLVRDLLKIATAP